MTEITLTNVTKRYGAGPAAAVAVDDVTLTVQPGELYFLLGPSGCGKTTLLRIVAGLVEPTAGRVAFNGRDVTDLPVEDRNTAMVFQSYALWPHMTVAQNVAFGPKVRGVPAGPRRRLVEENLARVRMEAFASRKPNQLSGGQQQRVALARALAARADCLLLDEPLSNLDARLRAHMRGELRRLVKQTGTTAVYVTHDQKEALSMADRIAVMQAGRVVQIGPPGELYERPASRFVADFLGEANFLAGRVLEAGPPARIETPVGVLRSAGAAPAGAGAAVTCCVRPERVALRAGPADAGAGELPARVVASTYLGEARQYACRLGEDVAWDVLVLAAHGPQCPPGAEVALRVRPEDVTVLAE